MARDQKTTPSQGLKNHHLTYRAAQSKPLISQTRGLHFHYFDRNARILANSGIFVPQPGFPKTEPWFRFDGSAIGVDEGNKPPGLTEGKLSEWTGLTTRRLRQIASEGFFPPPVKGFYQANAIPGMFRYLREYAEKKTSGAKEAERRLKNIKADIAEEELLIIRNKYVLKAEIGPALRNVSLNQRAVLQRKFEGEIGPKLAGKKTPEILELIAAAVDDVCGIFQEGTRAWLDEQPREDASPTKKKK